MILIVLLWLVNVAVGVVGVYFTTLHLIRFVGVSKQYGMGVAVECVFKNRHALIEFHDPTRCLVMCDRCYKTMEGR